MGFRLRGVETIPCPDLAPLIEGLDSTMLAGPSVRVACRHYLTQFDRQPDVLILGCSHYELIARTIQELLPSTPIICPGDATADAVWSSLIIGGQLATPGRPATETFVQTGVTVGETEGMAALYSSLLSDSLGYAA